MKYQFKTVSVYADKKNNLIIIANGRDEAFGNAIVEIDLVRQLVWPYSATEVESELLKTMDDYCKLVGDIKAGSPILKIMNVKSYAKAVKTKRLVAFDWDDEEGYYVTPFRKVKKGKGYESMEEEIIHLGRKFKKGDLAGALMKALEVAEPY